MTAASNTYPSFMCVPVFISGKLGLKEQLPSAAKLEYRPKPLGDRFLGNLYTKKNIFWNQKNISAKFQIFFQIKAKSITIFFRKNHEQKKSSDRFSGSFSEHIRKRSWESVGTFFCSWLFSGNFCYGFCFDLKKIWKFADFLFFLSITSLTG